MLNKENKKKRRRIKGERNSKMNKKMKGNSPNRLELRFGFDTVTHPKLMLIICSLSRTNEQHRFCSESTF